MISFYFAFFIILLFWFDETVTSKSIWGKKRNVKIVENGDIDLSNLISNKFNNENEKNNQLHYKNPLRREFKQKISSNVPPKVKEHEEVFILSEEEFFKLNKKKMIQIVQLYIKLIEQLISSPIEDIFELLGIEATVIQEFINNIPILKTDEKLQNSFNNPKELQNRLIELIKDIIKHEAFFINSFNDYKQFNTILLHIPLYLRSIIKSILMGDLNHIMAQLDKIPNVSKSQKELIVSIISGDNSIDSIINLLNQYNVDTQIMDPNRFETVRQQFTSNPDMAKMFGVPNEIIRSKKKFASLMTSGLETILSKSKTKLNDSQKNQQKSSIKLQQQQKRNLNGGSSPY